MKYSSFFRLEFVEFVMGSAISQQSAVATITQWQSRPAHELIFDSSHREITQYMQAVDKILQSPNIRGFEELLATSMDRLKLEFRSVLSRQANYIAGPTSVTECSSLIDSTACAIRYEDYLVYEKPNKQVVSYLRNVAERMIIGGNLGECIRAYIDVRKRFLENQLNRLRYEELSIGKSFEMADFEAKVELWIQVSKICFELFFEREKNFCEEIFQNLGGSIDERDRCFVGTVQDFAVRLFGFAKSVSLSDQPYERMVSVFGLYSGFLSVLDVSDTLFASESGKSIRHLRSESLHKIEQDVARMMYDFENAVLSEISNVFYEKGEIHRLTEYVMDQINLLVRHKTLLTNLIKEEPSLNFGDSVIPKEELGDYGFRTFLELHLILIIAVLLKNLERKSKKYEDPVLGNLFMMNNIHHIVQKIQGSEDLHEMIGDLYLNKLRQRVKQSMLSYHSSTSNKFLACFEDQGLYSTIMWFSPRLSKTRLPRLSKTRLKKRMKDFNIVFEEVRALHSSWTVPDLLLRDKIRTSMSETLVPAYQHFLEKFMRRCEIKDLGDPSIKHSAEELKALVLENLFANSS